MLVDRYTKFGVIFQGVDFMETAIINSEFITTVGLPGFICILTIICIGKTNKELKIAIDALTSEINKSNLEQKHKIENLESDIKELKSNMHYLQVRLGVHHNESIH